MTRHFCKKVVEKTLEEFGQVDVLVNNAGEQHPDEDIEDITEEQLLRTFQTNIFAMFYLTQAVRPHLGKGAAIINCTSVTMYKGSSDLLDYSATKGAITAFTRSSIRKPHRRRHPRQCRGPRTDLDTAQPLRRRVHKKDGAFW